MAIVLKSQFKMKKTLFIACLSLLSVAAVAANNNNKTVAQSKKQSGKQLPSRPIHCRYTTTCGTVHEFDITPEQIAKNGIGIMVCHYNDTDCGTFWRVTEVVQCPSPDPK